MKSYYDLTKQEKKELINEFKEINKFINLQIYCYVICLINFFPWLMTFMVFLKRNTIGISEVGMKGFIITSLIFFISLVLGIFYEFKKRKYNKEFNAWLTTKGIIK